MIHSRGARVIMSYVRDPIIWGPLIIALSVKYGRLYYELTSEVSARGGGGGAESGRGRRRVQRLQMCSGRRASTILKKNSLVGKEIV